MKKIVALALGIIPLLTQAQLVVNTTAQEAVNLLIGTNNVTVTNISFTGDPLQLGSMVGLNSTAFPLTGGVVLCTEDAKAIDPAGLSGILANQVNTEPDLLEVANSVPPLIGQAFTVEDVNDVCILEFDFVANGDVLSFDYVFASDEYLTWVNSQYNDVFAFFLSGPGITGTYASPAGFPNGAVNIAFVPNSNPPLPITISSVNDQLNSEYYIDNTLGQDASVILNGYTTLLTATHPIQCGQTYHMKLAIADGTDNALKSAVILREGSFDVSTSVQLNPIALDPSSGLAAGTLVEGCVQGFVQLTTPCQFDAQDVTLQFGGTAQFGQDYIYNGQQTITISPSDTINLDLNAIWDHVAEGQENITITFDYLDTEGVSQTVSATVNLADYEEVSLTIPDVYICSNGSTNFTLPIQGGEPAYTISWNDGSSVVSRTFTGDDAGQYIVSIEDFCGTADVDTFSVIIPTPFIVTDSLVICLNNLSEYIAEGGSQPYTYDFDTNYVSLSGTDLFLGVNTGITFITVTDGCGLQDVAIANVTVCDTRLPNVFTPDGNSYNQFFRVDGLENFPGSKLKVYSRWGTEVYSSDDYRNNWAASDVSDGTYFYELVRSDGKKYSGSVMILRK